jgi:DNA-binding NtrC family response regulator
LVRLERYGGALVAFRRAFELSEFTDNTNRAADAALAAFQEIGERLAVLEGGHLLAGRGLNEAIQSLEHDVIKLALENAQGSVVHAARSLRISFQALTYMLETRHKDLLKYRSPVRRRPRKQ